MEEGRYSTVYRNAYFGPNKCLVPLECCNRNHTKTKNGECDQCVIMACVDADIENLFGIQMRGLRHITLHFSGCNLDCKFCWAYPVNKEKIKLRKAEAVLNDIICICEEINRSRNLRPDQKKIKALILSGNEPLLQISHIVCLIEKIRSTKQFPQNLSTDLKILVRTNGILVKHCIKELKDLKDIQSDSPLEIKFQVSFKGVNQDQFSILTGKPPELFNYQVTGYKELVDIFGENNVFPTLGICHTERLRYGGKPYNFRVDITFQNGTKMNFSDFDKSLGNDLKKMLSSSNVHCQYFEWFPTIKSKKRHNEKIHEIIQITCPVGRTFKTDFTDLRIRCENIKNGKICNTDCRNFIAALHGKTLNAIREYDIQ